MDNVPACEKCGLRSVKHELERQGIILRFCDVCYWGALEADDAPADEYAPLVGPATPRAPERR